MLLEQPHLPGLAPANVSIRGEGEGLHHAVLRALVELNGPARSDTLAAALDAPAGSVVAVLSHLRRNGLAVAQEPGRGALPGMLWWVTARGRAAQAGGPDLTLTQLRVLRLLQAGARCATDIGKELLVTTGTARHNCLVLRNLGLCQLGGVTITPLGGRERTHYLTGAGERALLGSM